MEAPHTFDAKGNCVVPGLIDVHLQGAGGADILDATLEATATIARTSARFGVTGFLATTVFRLEGDNRHLSMAAELTGADLGGARLLGMHLEGPFISLKKKGMIRPDCIGLPSARPLSEIQSLAKGTLRMMTVAPELPGCSLFDAIRTVTEIPAKVLGLYPGKGTIREGCDADLAIVDDAVNVYATVVGGQIVYEKAGSGMRVT